MAVTKVWGRREGANKIYTQPRCSENKMIKVEEIGVAKSLTV